MRAWVAPPKVAPAFGPLPRSRSPRQCVHKCFYTWPSVSSHHKSYVLLQKTTLHYTPRDQGPKCGVGIVFASDGTGGLIVKVRVCVRACARGWVVLAPAFPLHFRNAPSSSCGWLFHRWSVLIVCLISSSLIFLSKWPMTLPIWMELDPSEAPNRSLTIFQDFIT